MSHVNMKVLSHGHDMSTKNEFIEENTPIKCFYNIKECKKSDTNIIEEIEKDFTYDAFMELMKKHSIVAIGPLLEDYDGIEQISFISSEHDYSWYHEYDENTPQYPEFLYWFNEDCQMVSREESKYEPSHYYGGVFVFRGVLHEILCKYISQYLDKNVNEVIEKIGVSQKSKIKSKVIYYCQQSSIREVSVLLKNIEQYTDSAVIPTQLPNDEQTEIIKMYIGEEYYEHLDFANFVFDNAIEILSERIYECLMIDDMKEIYGFRRFRIKYFEYSYGTIYCDIEIRKGGKTIAMYSTIENGTLEINFHEGTGLQQKENLICEQLFDISFDEPIIYLRPYALAPLAKYFKMDKFCVFMTRLFNLILESTAKVSFGNEDAKISGDRRNRRNDDEMIPKKQNDPISNVNQD